MGHGRNGSGKFGIFHEDADQKRRRESTGPVATTAEPHRHHIQWKWWILATVGTLVAVGFTAAVWLESRYEEKTTATSYRQNHRQEFRDLRDDVDEAKLLNVRIAVTQENMSDRLKILEAQQRKATEPAQRTRLDREIRKLREKIDRREKMFRKDPDRALEEM